MRILDLGNVVVNLDQVTYVLVTEPREPIGSPVATVHFTAGASLQLKGRDAKLLIRALTASAPPGQQSDAA